jgi:hypothetical protein
VLAIERLVYYYPGRRYLKAALAMFTAIFKFYGHSWNLNRGLDHLCHWDFN